MVRCEVPKHAHHIGPFLVKRCLQELQVGLRLCQRRLKLLICGRSSTPILLLSLGLVPLLLDGGQSDLSLQFDNCHVSPMQLGVSEIKDLTPHHTTK
jgi:hypothetical protein